MVKPRYEEASSEAYNLLKRAKELEDRIEKAAPNFAVTFNTDPQDVMLVSESGGHTRNAHYTTNQHLLESTDVANKGATSESVNIDTIPMNERGDQSGRLVEG